MAFGAPYIQHFIPSYPLLSLLILYDKISTLVWYTGGTSIPARASVATDRYRNVQLRVRMRMRSTGWLSLTKILATPLILVLALFVREWFYPLPGSAARVLLD